MEIIKKPKIKLHLGVSGSVAAIKLQEIIE